MTVQGAGAVQEVPWDTVNILTPFFGRGPDPSVARFLALPMLRGLWVGTVASGGHWIDVGGLDMHLTYNGNPQHNYYRLVPYWDLDGVGDYFNHVDHANFDILGTETYVAAPARGLTMGGWFRTDTIAAGQADFMGKYQVGVSLAYLLERNAANVAFIINGGLQVVWSTVTLSANAWYFIVCRFVPSTTIDIYVNGTKSTLAAGIPAALPNTANDFTIGAAHGGARCVDGRASFCFLCASALSDTIINSLYHLTKGHFGH